MKSQSPTICSHLYEVYPNMPKYANDPQQSQIIRVYDVLLKRYQGIYGQQPKYFIRSPASLNILGSVHQSVNMSAVSICSLQNIVVCIAKNGNQKIRVNHYQTAVYGEKIFQNQEIKWKYNSDGDQYTNLIIASLKTFVNLFNLNTITGLDILIYDDFIKDQHLNWAEALCLGIGHAIFSVTQPISSIKSLGAQFWLKYLGKIGNIIPSIKKIPSSIIGEYNKMSLDKKFQSIEANKIQHIEFPKEYEIIMAHSMTPLPKKMTKGKRENLRYCQIFIGIEIIKNQLGLAGQIDSLKSLQKQLNCSVKELLETVEEYIPKQELSAERIQQLTQKSLIEILKTVPFANNVIDENLTYKPYKRIKYFLEEQLDIECLQSQNLLKFIKASYERSKDLLEIRSDQIDQMIEIFKDLAEAYKVVGDGWGGYLLILSQPNHSKAIVEQLVNKFYMSQNNRMLLSDDVDQYIKIIEKPSTGVTILDPSSQIWFC